MKRINENNMILGTVVVNQLGFPELTNMDSLSSVKYASAARMLSTSATHALRCIKANDEVLVVRLETKKTEVFIVPDPEFHLVAIMQKSVARKR